MRTTKRITYCGVTVALLLAVQMVLSGIAGVELVTAIFLCFCVASGVKMSMLTATAYALVRCLIFGFTPTAVILYLIYWNLFSLLFGFMGAHMQKAHTVAQIAVFTALAVIMTVCFTMLDNLITPLYYGFTASAARNYFYASLPVLFPQVLCVACSVPVLFVPLFGVFRFVMKHIQ